MDPEAERNKILQEYVVMHRKHEKEEENVRKRTPLVTQDVSNSGTNARKLPRLRTS